MVCLLCMFFYFYCFFSVLSAPPLLCLPSLTLMCLTFSFPPELDWLFDSVHCPVSFVLWLSSSAGLDWFTWLERWYLIGGRNFLAVSFVSESSRTPQIPGREDLPAGEAADCRDDWGRTAWGYSNPAAQIAQIIDQIQCLEASLLPPKGWIEPTPWYHCDIK